MSKANATAVIVVDTLCGNVCLFVARDSVVGLFTLFFSFSFQLLAAKSRLVHGHEFSANQFQIGNTLTFFKFQL